MRLSWCYGAPGIAAVLLRAAETLGRDDWRDVAMQIALWAAERELHESGVNDAEFCHGSAGLGHVFNRLYQMSGDERLAIAAQRWFDHALAARASQSDGRDGIAGYLTNSPTEEGEDVWTAEPAIVYGAAGIAAALAAATSDIEPSWDAMFLLSDARRN